MRNSFEKLFWIGCVIFTLALPAAAEPKIGIIDLRKVFDDYYKTKAANALLEEEAVKIEKERKGHMDAYQKATDEYKKALDDANNQAISADERDKRKKTAETRLLEIKELEQVIQQFQRTAIGQLNEQKRQAHDKIMKEIRVAVDAQAKQGGFNLVFDTAAESSAQTPIVLYFSGTDDLTALVLRQLNATAPPGTLSNKDEKSGKEERR
jgi:outer membrane protein